MIYSRKNQDFQALYFSSFAIFEFGGVFSRAKFVALALYRHKTRQLGIVLGNRHRQKKEIVSKIVSLQLITDDEDDEEKGKRVEDLIMMEEQWKVLLKFILDYYPEATIVPHSLEESYTSDFRPNTVYKVMVRLGRRK